MGGAVAFGRMLVKPPTSRFLAFIAGLGILRVVGLGPVLGGIAWTLTSIAGLGALLVAARRTIPEPPRVPAMPPPPAVG